MQKQRRLDRTFTKKNDFETKVIFAKCKNTLNDDKFRLDLMQNRSCYFSPETKDAQQLTEYTESYGHPKFLQLAEPAQTGSSEARKIKDLLRKLQNTLRDMLPEDSDGSSSGIQSPGVKPKNSCGDEFRQSVDHGEAIKRQVKTFTNSPKNVQINDEPRIKVIAEKFSTYKKDNVEVRRLEERIVCIEYDVFPRGGGHCEKPKQTLRAYFAVRPFCEIDKEFPYVVKKNHNITDQDFNNCNEQGIEMIDANIPENKSYLEGLKRVLKHKRAAEMKKNKILDPMYLYQMAERDLSNTNYTYMDFLSNAEIEELKDLILKKTTSSLHGISRRKCRAERDSPQQWNERNTIINELFRFM